MSSVGFKLKGPPPKAPNYAAAAKNTDRVKEISYSEHDRKDFLTGFARRKKERREFAMARIAEKEKNEKKEQKKFANLQREAFQQSIIDARKKHEEEFDLGSDNDGENEEEQLDENGNKIKKVTQEELIKSEVKKSIEISTDDISVTTVIKPLSFNSDGEEEEDDEDDDDDEESEQEENNKNKKSSPVVKKTPTNNNNNKKTENKFKKDKDQITADKLVLINPEQKIYQDEKGRKIKMKKEKGKFIPVVLTEAAETALEKGWKLPRALRTKEKKSWSFSTQKKNRKKARKEKKGK